jgi:hypothetical protein
MPSIDNFLSEVYSEEIYSISESEFDEVMMLAAQDDESQWAGYDEWSEHVEAAFSEGDVENFTVQDGAIFHKPEPKRGPFIAGVEI